MRMIPPVRRLRARSSIVPTTPPAIHVAPTQAATVYSSQGGARVDDLGPVAALSN